MPAFETPEPIAVTVEVLSGNVTVIASDRTDTVVEVRPADASKTGDVRAAEQTEVDFAAGTLTVKTPKGWRTYTPFGGNPSVEVTIEVPTGSRLKGTAAVGRLLGSGELGQCDLEISAGDIIIERPHGSVTAKTAKGDIRIGEASRGVLRLETSMGELEVGIRPGSAAHLEVNAQYGTVQNQMQPVGRPQDNEETVQVYARNSYGNIVIRHATAA
ncbi:DUF4097 domain-containing protein [Nocardia asteroides]|uniref:DUF4097 family beta strand repeat-containing protein n=1 Tax=Nocardia TaxID=1817 RepID=UPI00135CD55A|nr:MULTISPECIES: DUF4097 family beta strand repeat-containing protein [Nocardia]MBF6204832.1 DUF4097 family beta strand repeat protein [Streptomyces gardneri]UAK33988.1 DUF4097 domain-containing protein [Nocardia asteroides]